MRLFIMFGAFMICDALNYEPSKSMGIAIMILMISATIGDITEMIQKNNGGK